MSWTTAPLGDHVDILSGFAFKSDQFNGDGNGMPLVRIRDVKGGRTQTYYDGEYDPKFMVEDGDLLVGMDGEFNCCPWSGGKSLLNQRVCRVSAANGALDQMYLNRFLPLALKKIEAKTSFVTVKHLSSKDIRKIEIPLPPLPEQKRIAAALDQAESLVSTQRSLMTRVDDLERAFFDDVVGDPVSNPKSWPVFKLDQVTEGRFGIKAGPFGSSLKKSDYTKSGYRVYGQEQVIAGRFDVGDYYIDKAKFLELQSCSVREGDVLVSLVGSFGKILVVPPNIEPGIINPRLLKITPNTGMVTSLYISLFLKHPSVQKALESRSHGGTMGILNAGILRTVPVPMPPMQLQLALGRQLQMVLEVSGDIRSRGVYLDRLKAALVHRAFRGEL